MKTLYQAIKVICDYCDIQGIFVQEIGGEFDPRKSKSKYKTPRGQAVSKGWKIHQDNKCICLECQGKSNYYYNKSLKKGNEASNKEYSDHVKKNKEVTDATNKNWLEKNPDYYKKNHIKKIAAYNEENRVALKDARKKEYARKKEKKEQS